MKSSRLIKTFYSLKPFIPRKLQIAIRRRIVETKQKKVSDIWPILEKAGNPPEWWQGWPEGKKFAVVLTHDVESQTGHDNCRALAEVEKSFGFRSIFNFVPERYKVSSELRQWLTKEGFEVGVHGLVHDGKLFKSRQIFSDRAAKINRYLDQWNARGFRAPAMHHNLDWLRALDIQFDMSTFDTDPFEPQNDGVETIFPFWVDGGPYRGFVELPYTLPQDFTSFVLFQEKNISIWQQKTRWIAKNGGMVLLNVHPDYITFQESDNGNETYSIALYRQFLQFLQSEFADSYWPALPSQVAEFINRCTKDPVYRPPSRKFEIS